MILLLFGCTDDFTSRSLPDGKAAPDSADSAGTADSGPPPLQAFCEP